MFLRGVFEKLRERVLSGRETQAVLIRIILYISRLSYRVMSALLSPVKTTTIQQALVV